MFPRALAVALGLTAACGSPAIDEEVEGRLTISQGVYGQTSSVLEDCADDCPVRYERLELTITGVAPYASPRRLTSGEQGFYERWLEPGTFRLCAAEECIDFSLGAGERRRLDHQAGGGGWRRVNP